MQPRIAPAVGRAAIAIVGETRMICTVAAIASFIVGACVGAIAVLVVMGGKRADN